MLLKSQSNPDQDLSYNMCSSQVEATFTAGPKRAKFEIDFSNENVEGDETITVS